MLGVSKNLLRVNQNLLRVQTPTCNGHTLPLNTFNFAVPFLSVLAIGVLTFMTIVLYLLPLRLLVLIWGVNKFTKKLRSPNAVPNNELLDFLSRVPCDDEIVSGFWSRDTKMIETEVQFEGKFGMGGLSIVTTDYLSIDKNRLIIIPSSEKVCRISTRPSDRDAVFGVQIGTPSSASNSTTKKRKTP
uniref:Uncharacterized protein n=1 Tax=Romanomermis culicivorax TaxID=13658 RepID=A0A915KH24_ROMCU